jgi:hypothetical protein
LAERALRERWPVPPDRLPGLVSVLADLAESGAAKPRERIAAIKALVGASRHNLEALRVSMMAEEFEALQSRLAALGGLPGPESGGDRAAGGGDGGE